MLELRHISKTFVNENGSRNEVLKDVSLTIETGEFVCIIGSNGTGKSTLLNIISGSVEQSTGDIFLDSENIGKTAEHIRTRNINRVFQDPSKGTCPSMTVKENLAMAMKKQKLFSLRKCLSFKEEKYMDLLENFLPGFRRHLNTPVGNLSGGQRQSISLLMSSLSDPQVLLLDEHTAALDPKTSDEVIEMTDRIVRKNGITTLMVIHNLRHAIDYGDRIIMLHKGKVILDVKGEDKKSLTVEEILENFEYAV